MNKAGIVKIKY